ncbi:MAG: hypothetical protein JWL94_1089 [Microbacteriaceae bacterium]|jgi:hypothetical protein|nr:hypothetical protein [Microbacteriaceae bacterium]
MVISRHTVMPASPIPPPIADNRRIAAPPVTAVSTPLEGN